ncbi:MAG: T9SS type A sorting domain-containing protein [Bacteroidota bacterium]|jgi:hypothetical protein
MILALQWAVAGTIPIGVGGGVLRFIFGVLACWLIGQGTSNSQVLEYPFQPGNLWQYVEYMRPDIILQVEILRDTTMANGKTYSVFSSNCADVFPFFSCGYFREEHGQFLGYDTSSRMENAIFDFASSPGDTAGEWIHDGCMEDTLYSRSRICCTFTNIHNWFTTVAFADSIGMIGYGSLEAFNYQLRGARINGVSYGIVGVEQNRFMMPEKFSIAQNYPNPFNPTSTISYSLPQKSFVTLKLCDLLGREVRTLVNGEQEPGNYSRIVDASDLPSGVYFYRLQAGNPSASSGRRFTDIKKMVLLK